jgi:hypothetical protein
MDEVLWRFAMEFDPAWFAPGRPSNSEAARRLLDDFLARFPEHRAELVEFACELTLDAIVNPYE